MRSWSSGKTELAFTLLLKSEQAQLLEQIEKKNHTVSITKHKMNAHSTFLEHELKSNM